MMQHSIIIIMQDVQKWVSRYHNLIITEGASVIIKLSLRLTHAATHHITEKDVQKWDSNYGTINNYSLVIATDLFCNMPRSRVARNGAAAAPSTLNCNRNRLESRYTTEQGGQEWCSCSTLDIKLWCTHRNQLESRYTIERGGQEWCSCSTLDINLW